MTDGDDGNGPVIEPAVPGAGAKGPDTSPPASVDTRPDGKDDAVASGGDTASAGAAPAAPGTAAMTAQPGPAPAPAPVKITGKDLTSVWLSYLKLGEVAEKIADEIGSACGDRVLVAVGDEALQNLRRWRQMQSMVAGVLQRCETRIAPHRPPPPQGGPTVETPALLAAATAATGVIGAVTQTVSAASKLIGLFRTETEVTQSTVKTDDDALAAAVTGALVRNNGALQVRSARLLLDAGTGPAGLVARLLETRSEASRLAQAKPGDTAAQADLAAATALIDDVLASLEAFSASDRVAALSQGEAVDRQLQQAPGDGTARRLLTLKAIAAGGDRLTIKRHFFAATELWVNGVVVVSYSLIDGDARVLAAGNVHGHTGYQRYADIRSGLWARGTQ